MNESARDSMNHIQHVMLAAKGRNRGTEFGCTFCDRVANLRTRKGLANTKSPIVILGNKRFRKIAILGNKRFREINLGKRYLRDEKKITLIIYVLCRWTINFFSKFKNNEMEIIELVL